MTVISKLKANENFIMKGQVVNTFSEMDSNDLEYILQLYKTGRFNNELSTLGKGSYGLVKEYKHYAIKQLERVSSDNSCRDVEVLKNIHHLPHIPTLYATINDDLIIVEKITGLTVKDYCEGYTNELNIDEGFIELWQNALCDIMREGYSPEDLHESNVMICKKTITPKIVDVGLFFRHNAKYDDYAPTSLNEDYGYSRAEMWTGKTLRDYVAWVNDGMKEEKKYLYI